MTKMLILKLSDKEKEIPFNDEEKLKSRANGKWRITPQKIGKIEKALLLFRGQVIAEYKIKPTIIYDRSNKRTTFDMETIKNSKYIGKMIDYKTANPASTIEQKSLETIII